jgi:hypothetical protein
MMKRGLWVALVMTVLLLVMAVSTAWAAPVWQEGTDADPSADPLWGALVPLLATATAIERVMERFWERYERQGRWPKKEGVRSQDRKTEKYMEFKKGAGHWLGFALAVIAIAFTDVRLFNLLGLDVLASSGRVFFDLGIGGIFDDFTFGTLVDWVATAIIIGWGGTELTHSILTSLVRGRRLWEEMKEVKAGEKSVFDVEFFEKKIAPDLQDLGISMATLRQAFQTLNAAGVPVDTIISEMSFGTAQEFLRAKGQAGEAMLALLEGTPKIKAADPVRLGGILDKLPPELRKRYLGV